MELLGGLPDDERRAVLAEARRRKFARREVLFHEGDPADTVHLVERGRVAIRITSALGSVVTLDVVGPGGFVGELALLPPAGPRSASAVALERVETRVLRAATFDELRARHPAVTDVVLGLLGDRVRTLNARLIEALYVPADVRVLRRLVETVELYGAPDDTVVPLTQEDLAGLAGTTRETVNRVLRREEERGVVALGRGRVDVLDLPQLAAAAR